MEKFLGGSPLAVALRLVVISIIVGIVLAALGLGPFDVLHGIRTLAIRIYDMGFEAIEQGVGYLLTGAAIVVPVWFVARLLGMGKRDAGGGD